MFLNSIKRVIEILCGHLSCHSLIVFKFSNICQDIDLAPHLHKFQTYPKRDQNFLWIIALDLNIQIIVRFENA
jgi:hypothetical protein